MTKPKDWTVTVRVTTEYVFNHITAKNADQAMEIVEALEDTNADSEQDIMTIFTAERNEEGG